MDPRDPRALEQARSLSKRGLGLDERLARVIDGTGGTPADPSDKLRAKPPPKPSKARSRKEKAKAADAAGLHGQPPPQWRAGELPAMYREGDQLPSLNPGGVPVSEPAGGKQPWWQGAAEERDEAYGFGPGHGFGWPPAGGLGYQSFQPDVHGLGQTYHAAPNYRGNEHQVLGGAMAGSMPRDNLGMRDNLGGGMRDQFNAGGGLRDAAAPMPGGMRDGFAARDNFSVAGGPNFASGAGQRDGFGGQMRDQFSNPGFGGPAFGGPMRDFGAPNATAGMRDPFARDPMGGGGGGGMRDPMGGGGPMGMGWRRMLDSREGDGGNNYTTPQDDYANRGTRKERSRGTGNKGL